MAFNGSENPQKGSHAPISSRPASGAFITPVLFSFCFFYLKSEDCFGGLPSNSLSSKHISQSESHVFRGGALMQVGA